ncbi:MAG: twin-arginine translocase subunit TatC [Archaeoglobaceae archaeon]|nr:twin-arginine translocase subunit TatC [Archaeoglobaceae archaeon]MDW8117366.1 twin-arginine translocase subunit TatC [Archaeoglobaceae archaeon]
MEAKDWARIIVEIRKNLIRIFILLVVVVILSFPFTPVIVDFVIEEMYPKPILSQEEIQRISEELQKYSERLSHSNNTSSALEEIKKISKLISPYLGPIVLTPVEVLVLSVKISIALGIASVIPYIIFLASRTLKSRGLLKSSTGYYAISSLILFILGVLYGFFIMKIVIQFLHNITISQGVIPLYSLAEFVNFVLFMIVIFGFFFQIPVVMVFLVRNGVVQYRTISYYRRHSYVLFFILSAIATPTVDIFTQTMLALPMIFLFEVGLIFSKIFSPAQS